MLSYLSSVKKAVLCLLLGLTLNAGAAVGGVGDSILESKDNDLFRFFQVDSRDSSLLEESRLVLRPETPYLSEVTQLRVRLNEQGIIQRMELWMEEEFTTLEWVRAYDLAFFFLTAGIPEKDADAVKLLKTEIEFPQDKEIYYKDMEVPDMPSEPSRAYQAFTGKIPSFNQKLSESTLVIERTSIAGKTWLRMIITDDDAPVISYVGKRSAQKI
jgi:hypothetical protein